MRTVELTTTNFTLSRSVITCRFGIHLTFRQKKLTLQKKFKTYHTRLQTISKTVRCVNNKKRQLRVKTRETKLLQRMLKETHIIHKKEVTKKVVITIAVTMTFWIQLSSKTKQIYFIKTKATNNFTETRWRTLSSSSRAWSKN